MKKLISVFSIARPQNWRKYAPKPFASAQANEIQEIIIKDFQGGSELLIGLDVEPKEGMRVVLCTGAVGDFPELLKDSGGTPEEPGEGIITWVDPEGDGGDVCEVQWETTGIKADYRTGFEDDFRLALCTGETHADPVGVFTHGALETTREGTPATQR
jgi:hypothetical protein